MILWTNPSENENHSVNTCGHAVTGHPMKEQEVWNLHTGQSANNDDWIKKKALT